MPCMTKTTPENCKLTAHYTGDGWALCVEQSDSDGSDVLCYLEWPKQWPDSMSRAQLEKCGFEIV